MEGICSNGDDAFKFTGATIWRIYTGEKSFLRGHRNADWGSGVSAFFGLHEPSGSTRRQDSSFVRGIQKIRQASLISDFNGKLNSASRKRIRGSKMGHTFYDRLCFPVGKSEAKVKDDG